MGAFSGFYESHGPTPSGNAHSIAPLHRHGYRNSQRLRYICLLSLPFLFAHFKSDDAAANNTTVANATNATNVADATAIADSAAAMAAVTDTLSIITDVVADATAAATTVATAATAAATATATADSAANVALLHCRHLRHYCIAATTLPLLPCALLPLRRCAAAALPPPLSYCTAATTTAATAVPPFVGWLLHCCLPSNFVIACHHTTVVTLVAGCFC